MTLRTKLVFVISAVLIPISSPAQEPWQVLKRVTHRACVSFRTTDRCIYGEIKKITDDAVYVTACGPGRAEERIARSELQRVTDSHEWNLFTVGHALYSGRSSWGDVTRLALGVGKKVTVRMADGSEVEGKATGVTDLVDARAVKPVWHVKTSVGDISVSDEQIIAVEGKPQPYNALVRVTTNTGKKRLGKISSVSPTQVVIDEGTKSVTIGKTDVKRVDLMQEPPPSDSLAYVAQEMGGLTYLDPEAWWYWSVGRTKVAVRVYQAGLPEANETLYCAE